MHKLWRCSEHINTVKPSHQLYLEAVPQRLTVHLDNVSKLVVSDAVSPSCVQLQDRSDIVYRGFGLARCNYNVVVDRPASWVFGVLIRRAVQLIPHLTLYTVRNGSNWPVASARCSATAYTRDCVCHHLHLNIVQHCQFIQRTIPTTRIGMVTTC